MKINPSGLLPHQPAAAEALLNALLRHGAALDASDMGVGKTYTCGAVLRARNAPTLVVGPKVSEAGWLRMGKHLGVEFDYLNYEKLRTGNTPFGWWDNPVPKVRKKTLPCLDCRFDTLKGTAPCPYNPGGIHCVDKPKNLPHDFGRFNWHPGIGQLVFDEAHRCAALDSLHADMVVAARRQRIPTLALSATLATSPLNFRALGFLLGLHNLVDAHDGNGPVGFYRWAYHYGCRKLPFRGLHFAVGEEKRQALLQRLHGELFPSRGVRISVQDIPGFPECDIRAELYNVEAAGRINELHARMEAVLTEARAQHSLRRPGVLSELLGAREEIELLMLPVFAELAQDAVASGKHVAIFLNFRRSVNELARMLKTDCIIIGGQKADERVMNVARFQSDQSPYIIATADAGGISIDLHDINGNFPRLGLVSLGYSATAMRQVFGRLRRAGGRSKALYRCILAAGTVQERTHKILAPKLDNLDLINDADLCANNLPLTEFLPEYEELARRLA